MVGPSPRAPRYGHAPMVAQASRACLLAARGFMRHGIPERHDEPAPVERQDENHHQPRAAAHDVTSTCSRVLAAAIFRLKARSSTSAAAHCATHVPTLYTWIGFHQPSGSY